MGVTVNLKQISQYTTESDVRGHTTLIDRPESKGGTDRGAMGGEHLLVALGGCFMSNLLEIVRNRESDITDIHVSVDGTLDGTPKHFTAIEMHVTGTGDADELEKFVTMAERGCIVANTLKDAVNLSFKTTALAPDAG
ncbi:MAG: OsmC family protein [Chloroflexota bacterium]